MTLRTATRRRVARKYNDGRGDCQQKIDEKNHMTLD